MKVCGLGCSYAIGSQHVTYKQDQIIDPAVIFILLFYTLTTDPCILDMITEMLNEIIC